MVDLDIKDFSRDDWRAANDGLLGQCLVQSWEYGEAKADIGPWRAERGLIRAGRQTIGAWQAQLRHLPCGLKGGLAWINRGPLAAPDAVQDTAVWSEMLAALRDHYTARGFYLRLAPPVTAETLSDVPVGFEKTGTAGWASATLDLAKDMDDLRRGLRQNWRNALNKAERGGLVLRSGDDDALTARAISAYRHFIEDRGYATTVTPDLIERLQALLPEAERLAVFLAEVKEDLAGWALVAVTGERAEYLAGHVEAAGRRLGAGQFLLWQAVVAMKERGLKVFDLGGMDPVLTPKGIYDFKDGLGGRPYRLADELEAGGTGVLGRLVRWRVATARAAA